MAGGVGCPANGNIKLLGGINAASGPEGYKQITDEAVIADGPDVILMMDREGDLEISNDDIASNAELAASPAVSSGRIVWMDRMLLLGFGPRIPAAALMLC